MAAPTVTITLLKSNDPVSIAVDSSGVKVHNSGDWIRHVWKVRKGYLKMHFAVNIKTKQVVGMDLKTTNGESLSQVVVVVVTYTQ